MIQGVCFAFFLTDSFSSYLSDIYPALLFSRNANLPPFNDSPVVLNQVLMLVFLTVSLMIVKNTGLRVLKPYIY